MIFTLKSFTYLIAEQDMRCDALGVWLDCLKGYDFSQKLKGVGVWGRAWRGILKGDAYLEYTFEVIDEDTGEVEEQVLNCRIDMNKVMVKYDLYPPIIKQAFKKYKA